MAPSKQVLLAGYPKSGNTWLGYMLSFLLDAEYVDLHTPGAKPTKDKKVLDLIQGGLGHSSPYTKVCKTHSQYRFTVASVDIESFDKTIHIVRDPRDVAVSYFYFQYCNLPVSRGQLDQVITRKPWPIRQYRWKTFLRRTAREWVMHTMNWRAFSGTRMFRYEDLHADPASTLDAICKYLEVSVELELIAEAVEKFSFDRLSGGRRQGEEYAASFYRKGIVGDHENHFDRLDQSIVAHYCGKEMDDLGYR